MSAHDDGGGCYVFGRTEVREGVAPMCDEPGCGKLIEDYWEPREFKLGESGEHAIGRPVPSKCKYCGFELGHDEGWCDRVCDPCREEERELAEQDAADYWERDYDPDEDRTP